MLLSAPLKTAKIVHDQLPRNNRRILSAAETRQTERNLKLDRETAISRARGKVLLSADNCSLSRERILLVQNSRTTFMKLKTFYRNIFFQFPEDKLYSRYNIN